MVRKMVTILSVIVIAFFLWRYYEWDVHKPDLQGEILDVKQSSLLVVPDNVRPDASYRAYEVRVNGHTEMEGIVNTFSGLKRHQKVKIWFGLHRSKMIDHPLAWKIIVSNN